jgi:hypothetical protein
MIAEDDIEFTAPDAFKYFCDHRPNVYDLYLGAISYGKINAENHVNDFLVCCYTKCMNDFMTCFYLCQKVSIWIEYCVAEGYT